MFHALYTADRRVFLAILIVYYSTVGVMFLWVLMKGTWQEAKKELGSVVLFGLFFFPWGLLVFLLLAETLCENIKSLCRPW